MLKIGWPFHGAVLNRRHGQSENGSLQITVSGECPAYGKVTVRRRVREEGEHAGPC